MPFDFSRRAALVGAFALALGQAWSARADDAQPSGPPGSYRLGAGDKVRVIVFGEDQLSGEFEVSGAGALAMPLLGEIQVVGLTTAEVQERIATGLREGYIRDPKVSVEVLNYRPFYILGEVGKPGEYPYTDKLTVMNAVATAGGFTYRADVRRVYIKHAGEADERVYPLDSATTVAPGDTIRIRERYF